MLNNMKIALVHEFLNQLGGAEKVLEDLLEIWPDATVHVILYDKNKTHRVFEKAKKKISWLDKFPLTHKHPRLFLPLMTQAIESFNFKDYDVVFSDSSSFAKGALSRGKLHICYCHTPTRFVWTEPDYLKNQKYPGLFKGLGKFALKRIKSWDYKAAQRPQFFIANSTNVQNRISKFYGRDSIVIYPPVDTEFFKPTGVKKDYFLTVSRLEPYKKIDVLIEAFNELGLPLKIVGTGTVADDLKKKAKPNIEFLGRVEGEELRKLYSETKAFVFPAEEDAGIVMLEAQSCGTPVIAYKAGGALELVKEGVTGQYFTKQSAESIKEQIKAFDPQQYNAQTVRIFAQQFDKSVFKTQIKKFVEEKYQQYQIPNS